MSESDSDSDIDEDGRQFLDAVSRRKWKTIKAMLSSNKIPLDEHELIRDQCDRTALMLASQNGHLDVVRFLVEDKHVPVDGEEHKGTTALHWACEQGRMEVMKYLFENGADIDRRAEYNSDTPLHFACRHGRLSAVDWLLETGANPFIQNHVTKETALDNARYDGYEAITKLFERHIQQLVRHRLMPCYGQKIPMNIWPYLINRFDKHPKRTFESLFRLIRESPLLFHPTPDDTENNQQEHDTGNNQQKQDDQKPSAAVPHPDCQVCNNNNNNNKKAKRKREIREEEVDEGFKKSAM